MALPNKFNSSIKYFESTMSFLKEFSWIYKISNTNFIKDGILNEFPTEWKNYFLQITNENLNLFPCNANKDQIPESLKLFQKLLNDLKPTNYNNILLKFNEAPIYFRKMNPKKLHEISQLSRLIAEICQNDIDILIDFGSGLGYLSEILHKNYNYKILGLECDEKRVYSSIERQQTYYPNSKNDIFYKQLYITESCNEIILKYLNDLFPKIKNPKIAIIGLHSCADLTITSMKLFFQFKIVQKLIIMPCCYHKLELIENTNNKFKNFPLSETLRNVVNNSYKNDEIFNRPFLRLACQETLSRWMYMTENEHFKHGNEMFIRGILESILNKNEFITKVKNYKNILIESNNLNQFDQIKKQYQLKEKFNNDCILNWTEKHQENYQKILIKYPEGYKLSEGLTCLQTSLQSLCENLVLYDRICFMEEQAFNNNIEIVTSYQKIMNDALSPRCFALIAEKHT